MWGGREASVHSAGGGGSGSVARVATHPARFADSSHSAAAAASAAAATFGFEEQMPRNERDFPSPMCASAHTYPAMPTAQGTYLLQALPPSSSKSGTSK